MEVCHHCDNPPCYEMAHLFLGSRADNMRDMAAKSRGRRPENRPFCPNGHAFTPENTKVCTDAKGHVFRSCRECGRVAVRRWQAAHPDYGKEWHRRKAREPQVH